MNCSPVTALSCTSGMEAAYAEVVATKFLSQFSKAIIRVMIFVVLAMLTAVFSLLPKRIRPESASIRTAYFAYKPAALAVTGVNLLHIKNNIIDINMEKYFDDFIEI